MSAQPAKIVTSTVQKVDCKNDYQMVKAGLRPPLWIQDAEWHKQTVEEKRALSRMSKIKGLRPSAPPKLLRGLPHRLTVHMKNLKKDPSFKTTVSATMYKDQIYEYMAIFFSHLKDEIKVVYFNGKNITEKLVL